MIWIRKKSSLAWVPTLKKNECTSGILAFQARPAPIRNPGQENTECVKAGWLDQLAVTEPRPRTFVRLLTAQLKLQSEALRKLKWEENVPLKCMQILGIVTKRPVLGRFKDCYKDWFWSWIFAIMVVNKVCYRYNIQSFKK